MPRAIWVELSGKRYNVGEIDQSLTYRIRKLTLTPYQKVDGLGPRMRLLKDLIEGKGYSVTITENGVIQLDMPCGDSYGWLVREVARFYYLENAYIGRPTQ